MSAGDPAAVSVIVATRSRPELLRLAAGSILAQDYPGPIELVIVFDQAEPEAALADELPLSGQAGPRSLELRSNRRTPGLAGARNSGVAGSSGPVLAFCDDDDTWRPTKISTQLAALARSGAELSVSGIEIRIGAQSHIRIPRPEDVTLATLVRRRTMEAHPSTVLVTRAAFDRIGEVDEKIPGSYGEDYDWMLRAVAGEDVAVVGQALVTVLWHPGSFFSTRWPVIIDALDYLVAKHPELRASKPGRARIYGQKAFAHAALGERRAARHWAWQSLRLSPRERRPYLAILISTGLVSAARIIAVANARGRGL
jgi:glycosyltransferase involved in cell wall biosynthesis